MLLAASLVQQVSMAAAPALPNPTNSGWDTFSDTWVGTDGLGRVLPGAKECGGPKKGKLVGIFYFLWLEGKGPIYDLTKLRAANAQQPAYGPPGAFHFWGEPLWGYYRSDDLAVIRKHAQMLADAGVDVIFFDVTNAFIYEQNYLAVCRVLSEMRRQGQRAPQVAFLANSHADKVMEQLWQKFYSQNLHADLWFRWLGRPLVLAPRENLSPALCKFFEVRRSWAWTDPKGWFGNGQDKWPWLDHTPQKFGWHDSPQRAEQIAVAVAEHPVSNIGRSFHDGHQPAPGHSLTSAGLYFAEQWARALEVSPEFVFVTGWNEWIAQRFLKQEGKAPGKLCGQPLKPGDTYFVDTWSQEYSRDIEPMKGGHGDNYYYQLASYVRRYKGARPLAKVAPQAIAVDGKFDDWREVQPEFRDTLGDPVQRDHPGWKGQPQFVNRTGRNDLMAAKVSADGANIYFYVRTREAITPCTDTNWMLLFIDADHNAKTGWLGYDFVVNRSNVRAGQTTIARNAGGKYRWEASVDVEYRVAGNELELAIPRAVLGVTNASPVIDFKWADNIQQTGEWSDFTLNGDVAPNDRFNYRAVLP